MCANFVVTVPINQFIVNQIDCFVVKSLVSSNRKLGTYFRSLSDMLYFHHITVCVYNQLYTEKSTCNPVGLGTDDALSYKVNRISYKQL